MEGKKEGTKGENTSEEREGLVRESKSEGKGRE